MPERICRMPAFDGRSGICGKAANRVLRSNDRGAKVFVCIFHAAAELKARERGPKRRGRGIGAGGGGGGEMSGPSAAGAGGGWRGANKKYAPPAKGYAEYILLLLFVIATSLGMGLLVYGPNMMDAANQAANPLD